MLDFKTVVDNFTNNSSVVGSQVLDKLKETRLLDAYSEEEQLTAIKDNHNAIVDVSNRCESFLIKAITANPWCISLIEEPSHALIRIALTKNPLVMAVLSDLCISICEFALKLEPKVEVYVPLEFHKELGLHKATLPKPFLFTFEE